MATEKGYQGWTNYETWAVALWIHNEEYWQVEEAEGAYREAVEDAPDGNREEWTSDAAGKVADQLKSEFEDGNPLGNDASVYGDLLTAALGEVNWYEIAKNYVEKLDLVAVEKEAAGSAD